MTYKYFYRNKKTGKNLVTHNEIEDPDFELQGKFEKVAISNTSVNEEKTGLLTKATKLKRPKILKVRRSKK